MARREQYQRAANRIASYLADRQRPNGGFPGPDHYGAAAAAWLWSHFGADFATQLHRAWDRLARRPPSTHGEFNIYSLLHARGRIAPDPVDALITRIPFQGRHSANWMLLRAACRALPGPLLSPLRSSLEARTALLAHSRRAFIHDRPGVRSFAYHAFCGCLLADLWQHAHLRWAGRAAARAAYAIAPFILPNGDGVYLGRGQHQIFGCGALLYLFEAAARMTGDPELSDLADRLLHRLLSFQRRDGSFPLVLREGEPAEPWDPDPSLPGWYSYNRYADYLPFLGCLLIKAASADLQTLGHVCPPSAHPALRSWRRAGYVAVLSQPTGAPTNDLPFPYLCARGESLFPCYGREGDRPDPESTPLPYGLLANGDPYGFRDHLRYRLTESGLIGRSRLVTHLRTFEFGDHHIVCRDEIVFRRGCALSQFAPANFLFRTLRRLPDGRFETWHREARAVLDLHPEGAIHPHAGASASGRLVALRHLTGPLDLRPGQTLSAELRVRFL